MELMKIEKNVPMPPRGSVATGSIAGLLRKLFVGDSFAIEVKQRAAVIVASRRVGIVVATRAIPEQPGFVRVWRTA